MSKQMTPCEKLGYKVGDEFEVIRHHAFKKGQVVTLHEDDGTECPLFAGDGGGAGVFDGVECSFAALNKQVRKISNKLKPAKQALADAIHHSGGWPKSELLDFATSNAFGEVLCSASHPERKGNVWVNGDYYRLISCIKGTIANWHQTVLSRDEYFTAYPDQVKVEVNNETKHQVEVEMKSESEITIKVSDWHKNGELPPVGEIVDVTGDVVYGGGEVCCEVLAHVEDCAVIRMSYGLGCFQSVALSPTRTEREIAIGEIADVICHNGFLSRNGTECNNIAVRLFEAGYRKEVK